MNFPFHRSTNSSYIHPIVTGVPALYVAVLLSLSGCGVLQTLGLYTPPPTFEERIANFKNDVAKRSLPIPLPPQTRVDSVVIDSTARIVEIRFSDHLSYLPYRTENVQETYRAVQEYFKEHAHDFSLKLVTLNVELHELIPNYFRPDSTQYDRSRLPKPTVDVPQQIVRNVSRPFQPTRGLQNRHIGLWHSHGWYYNNQLDRWEWQRPRLFLSVEDLIPASFVLPYLIPMLEKAGATVFVPRERDVQVQEVIVDNDSVATGYTEVGSIAAKWIQGEASAFSIGTPPYEAGINPFRQGTHRISRTAPTATAFAGWIPTIPRTGSYAVYISYVASDTNAADAQYIVRHLGGVTEVRVNQRIGGNTWIYLGTFKFREGRNAAEGSVVLSNGSATQGAFVSADAVRFGGGMGVIARGGRTSGRPKFVEGSRYWLHFAGMPDTLVFSLNNERNDYRDDYQGRAEYLNFLRGAPSGPNKKRDVGLGIPIDLSLAFHTDAGITNNDTTVGTLSIYSIPDAQGARVFPDSMSRLANRDLADLIQTQIVDDLRATYDPTWSRRQLRNADYSEAVRPNMPSVLLELLSHQNFLDMKFVLDPRFRFDVARSIYKGMLRFLSVQHRVPYVVQPLAVTHLRAELDTTGGILLRWKPQEDPLEPSARPTNYVIYTRVEDGGFDNGRLVDTAAIRIEGLKPNTIYSFQVTAVNEGGESFPSEILAVCWNPASKRPLLIINGFDRISGPGTVEEGEFQGFLSWLDRGVPDRFEIGLTGEQFDFYRSSAFRTNDSPGHGASFSDTEGKIIAGNSFDYPYLHGVSLRAHGFSFTSVSDEAVSDSLVSISDYPFVDLILGKEKETHWPKPFADSLRGVPFRAFPISLQRQLAAYLDQGGKLFVSGAYVGSELFRKGDSTDIAFAQNLLRFSWATSHASRTGLVRSTRDSFFPRADTVRFNTTVDESFYLVESPDAIVPANGSVQLMRYVENEFGAAVGYRKEYGVVTFGFPFESILQTGQRTVLMGAVLRFLDVRPFP